MNTLQKLALSNYKWARGRAEAAVAIFQQYSKGNMEKEKFISLKFKKYPDNLYIKNVELFLYQRES